MSAIRTFGLTKHYGSHVGIDGLDIDVREGEVFGFLGPNGAGKTTTIRLLLDLLRPTAGRAEILGHDTRRDSVAVRRSVGYLPGDLRLYDELDGRRLLDYLASLRGDVAPGRIDALARQLDVDLTRPVHTLSKGNRQKLGIVQAFMHRPAVLVLDEPTAGLDPLVQQSFHELVRAAVDDGAAVFLSSHVLSEVQAVADRAAFVRDGRLVAVEDVDRLRRRALRRVEVAFQGPPPACVRMAGGVRDVQVDGARLRCLVEGDADEFVKAIAAAHVVSITSEEADLEDVFLAHYRGAIDAAA